MATQRNANLSVVTHSSLFKRSSASAIAIVAVTCFGATALLAKGGTAKPPTNPPPAGTPGAPLVNIIPPAPPQLISPAIAATTSGFSITGFIQSAVATCNNPTAGGSVTIHGTTIVIPANLIVQYPANTFSWTDAVCAPTPGAPPIAFDGTGGNGGAQTVYPSVEMRVEGNIVNGVYTGALAFVSQMSVQTSTGFITRIDYTTGAIYVGATPTSPDEVRLVINDKAGRFGRPQTPDFRFNVDDANPTIKAASGYPMCVPREAPAVGAETDPLCPQKNRPKPVGFHCRNFADAGLVPLPLAGDITQPVPGQTYCSGFVMKAIAGMPGTANFAAGSPNLAGPTDPDPRAQMPFEVGDKITFSGTLLKGDGQGPFGSDTISVHTIEANIGAFTQPRTLPAYVAMGGFGIGVEPLPKAAIAAGAGVESTPRIFLEGSVTDVASIVDVYLVDKDKVTGADRHRWVTMESMTGTLTFQANGTIATAISAQPFGGGISTQYAGPSLGRFRIRANKVPAIVTGSPCIPTDPTAANRLGCAVTASPTRYIRSVVRSLCAPAAGFASGTPALNPGSLDGGAFFDINGVRTPLPGATAGDGSCLQSAQFANGLFTGQYFAPVFEFIFPETVVPGAPEIPSNFWQMDFLVSGEGAGAPGLSPSPW